MADTTSMALSELLRTAAGEPDVDLLREALGVMNQALMEAEVEAHPGVGRHERGAARTVFAKPDASTAQNQWRRVADDPDLLTALGLPAGRVPCVTTFHRVFKALDVAAFAHALGGWLQQTGLTPGEARAVDGKAVRGVAREGVPGLYLVSVDAHAAEAVIAHPRTAGKGHQLTAARTLLRQVPVAGQVVTGDAVLTDRTPCTRVVEAGGDSLLPVDEHQPTLRADRAAAFSPLAADARGRVGTAARPDVAPGCSGGAGWTDARAHPARTKAPAGTAGDAHRLGARGPCPECVSGQQWGSRPAVAASRAGLPCRTTAGGGAHGGVVATDTRAVTDDVTSQGPARAMHARWPSRSAAIGASSTSAIGCATKPLARMPARHGPGRRPRSVPPVSRSSWPYSGAAAVPISPPPSAPTPVVPPTPCISLPPQA